MYDQWTKLTLLIGIVDSRLKNINKTDKHIHTHTKRYLEVISRSTRFKEFNREKNINIINRYS
jgi:hypothetical protein